MCVCVCVIIWIFWTQLEDLGIGGDELGSHAVAVLMHIDLSAQGSLTVQSSVFEMLTTYKSVVDLVNLGGILFLSIHVLIYL